jgi:cytochrome b6-f complex iron-sulfur subunit
MNRRELIVKAFVGGTVIALDSTCTHQGCTIAYSQANNNFPCPCHGSVYSATGTVITGPASIAVKAHTVTKAGNILTIT